MSNKLGWPAGMYNDDGELHCVASTCEEIFNTEASTRHQKAHYRDFSINSPNSMVANEHKILFLMHGLKRCLICKTNFGTTDQRILFDHHKAVHHNENLDIWTIEGYVAYVRKFPNGFLNTTQDQKTERKENFKAVYIRLQLSLKQPPFWISFKDFMGYRDSQLSSTHLWSSELCPLLTVYTADFFPIHPDNFLRDRQYNEATMSLTRDKFNQWRDDWQALYREGKI